MPIKLGTLTKMTKTVTHRFEELDESLTLTYRPRAYTATAESAFQDAMKENRTSEAVVQMLSTMLVKWDLLGDDGEPLPFDAATLRDVPTEILGFAITAIMEDMSVGKTTDAISGATS